MILNLPLIFFQARESKMPSSNILQICANLRPPHAPVVAICPVSFTIICFYASPSPSPHSPKRNDICILTDRQTLTPCSLSRSWGLQLALHHRCTWFLKCNLSTTVYISWTLLSSHSAQDSSNISSNGRYHHKLSSLGNNKTGILYLFLNVSLMFI